MIEYSGPLPPSGGVRRPPLAVIAPHCTQLDGLILTRDRAVLRRVLVQLVDLGGTHAHPGGRELDGDVPLEADVVRLVVAGGVAAREDARQLVEGELAVRLRVRRGAIAREEHRLLVSAFAFTRLRGAWPNDEVAIPWMMPP